MLDVSKKFAGNDYPSHLRTYSPGDSFGELCLYHNVKQAVAISGQTDYSVWKLDRGAYQWIIRDSALRKRYRHDRFLRAAPILNLLTDAEFWSLNDVVTERVYREGQVLVNHHAANDVLFIIMSGAAQAVLASAADPTGTALETINYSKGHSIGQEALISDECSKYCISARYGDDLMVLELKRGDFERMIGPMEQVMRRDRSIYFQYFGKWL